MPPFPPNGAQNGSIPPGGFGAPPSGDASSAGPGGMHPDRLRMMNGGQ
jgi:hypothetical protein